MDKECEKYWKEERTRMLEAHNTKAKERWDAAFSPDSDSESEDEGREPKKGLSSPIDEDDEETVRRAQRGKQWGSMAGYYHPLINGFPNCPRISLPFYHQFSDEPQ